MKIRFLLYILLSLLLFSSCGSSKSSQQTNKKTEQIVNFSYKYIGTPYRYGGTTPRGFDCSGFVQFVYNQYNYKLPRSTSDQSNVGEKIKDPKKMRQGDLVFYKGSNKRKKNAGHVGIIVSADGKGNFRFIHASSSRGIVISSSTETYYKDRYLYGRRVI